MAKVVQITSVSPQELEIDGGPTFLFISGKGFEYFKPKNPQEQPKGRFEAYIMDSAGTGIENKEYIEVVQPTSNSIKDDLFTIEVTVIGGVAPGTRKVVIKNKVDNVANCGSTDTCFLTASTVVALK